MDVLDEIIAGVRLDLAQRKAQRSLDELVAALADAPPALGVLDELAAGGVSVIAEVKRSSPSKGALADIADPGALAAAYAAGGAAAISVLTEQRRFGGSLSDLHEVRSSVSKPVLRKDFMVEEYQFFEAREAGADLVLLIVAALEQPELVGFLQLARDLELTALVETHTAEEVRRALDAGADLIGVNNRNLKTLEVDIYQFARLADLIGDQAVKVAESGIFTAADVRQVVGAGADAILVGEALVRNGDPAAAVAQLKSAMENS